ncbi:MAG: glycosyltransferase family 2 protein, partial [Proteobacteria bacterium]|nr:glycosyltransferase family 2 protein [Pseudomonadota bacterium]
NVRVLNMSEGVIPRMLDVNFTYSFDFIRAGQSRINTVMCTPGALSAYRRDVIMPVIDEWLNQTFMGQAAAIGEDRALTNLILREGYHVHFAREAQVFTNVPVKFNGLCKMLLRWARSNVRENLVMSGFAFKHFRDTPALGARINLIMSWFGMTVGEVLKTMALLYLLAYPLTVGYGMIAGGTLAALFPGIFYIMRHRSSNFLYAFPYSIFWMFGLSWISLYALFTPQKSAWLTRDLPQTQMQTRRFAKPSEADYPAASVLGSLQPAPIPVMNVTYSRGAEDMRL